MESEKERKMSGTDGIQLSVRDTFQAVTFTTPHIELSARKEYDQVEPTEPGELFTKVHHEKAHLNRIRRLRLTNRADVSLTRVTRPRSVAVTQQELCEVSDTYRDTAANDVQEEFEFDPNFNFDSSDEEDSARRTHEDDLFFNNSRFKSRAGKHDVTVDIYKKACRRLKSLPQGALVRQLSSPQVDMRYSGMGPVGTKACAIALVYNEHVTELDLTGSNIGTLGCEYISEVLQVNSTITRLILAENNICLRGLQCLCDVISQSRFVEHLDLSGNGFGEEGGDIIADLIEETMRLKSLNLSHNRLSEYGAIAVGSALPENGTLETLDLSWNHIRLRGAVGISSGIKENCSIRTLKLGWNGFSKEGCVALSAALCYNSNLENLDLTNNRIGTVAIKQLCQGFSQNSTLQALNLNLNPIGNDGALYLFQNILESPNCALADINIENQALMEETIKYLDETTIAKNKRLKVTYGMVLHQKTTDDQQDDSINDDPLIVLMEYMRQKNMRLLDLFNSLDADGSKSLSRDEFREGLKMVNIPLSSHGLNKLLDILDADGDGEVDFSELMEGQKEFRRRIMKMAGRTNSTENNTFARIQNKVRLLLHTRSKNFKSAAMKVMNAPDPAANENKMQRVLLQGVEDAQKQARNLRRQTLKERKSSSMSNTSLGAVSALADRKLISPVLSPRNLSPMDSMDESSNGGKDRGNSPINLQGLPPV